METLTEKEKEMLRLEVKRDVNLLFKGVYKIKKKLEEIVRSDRYFI